MNFKHLIISIISGLTVVVLLFFISEFADPTPSKVEVRLPDSKQLTDSVNSWANHRWNKDGYESLSADIQLAEVFSNEKEKENLKITLDSYYCNSIKLTFEDWKSQGCNLESTNPKVSELMQELNHVISSKKYRDMDTDPLKLLNVEYKDIRRVADIEREVNEHIAREFDLAKNEALIKETKLLSSKSYINRCSQLMDKLSYSEKLLDDFGKFVVNFEIKRRYNTRNTNKELCQQLKSSYPVDKYYFYNN